MSLSADTASLRPLALAPGDGVDIDRALRLPRLVGARAEAASALANLSVVVVGCGSIGGRIAVGLARLGVRRLLLVDPGSYKRESMLTHDITAAEVGARKASCVGARARALHPAGQVLVFDGPVADLRDGDFVGADMVLLATDDLLAEVSVGARALRLGLRLVQASVDGATLVAQVRTWPHDDSGAGACLLCGYGKAEFAALDSGTRFSCASDQAGGAAQARSGPPTRSAPPLCALAADLALLDVLRMATGAGAVAGPRLLEHAGLLDRTTSTPLRRNPRCRAEHDVPARAGLLRPLPAHTPAQLLVAAGASPASPWSLVVDGYELGQSARCACPDAEPRWRFLPLVGQGPPCPRCGEALRADAWNRRREVPGELLEPVLHAPLSELGVADATLATVEVGRVRLLLGGNP